MSKKLLAGLLAGAMAVSVIPQIALAEDEVKVEEPKYYLTDLTNYYEKDTFYHDGEELDEELIWRNDYNLDRSDLVTTLENGDTVWNIPKKVITPSTAEDGTVKYSAVKTGEDIPFKMTAENFSSHKVVTANDASKTGKDTIILRTVGDNGTSKTVNLPQERAKELYLLYAAPNKASANVGLDVNVRYTDGTAEDKHIKVSQINADYSVKTGSDYQGDWNAWGKRIYDVLDETSGKYYGGKTGNCWLEFPIYKIDLQADKKLDSITFNPIQTTLKGVGYTGYIYGITAIPMSNAELKAEIDACKITSVTYDNADEILKINSYIDELIERNAVTDADYVALRALKADAEFYSEKVNPTEYLNDISAYFEKDTIWGEGDSINKDITWNWERSLKITESQLMKNADNNTVFVVEESVIAKNSDDTYSSSKTGKKISFLIDKEAIKGSVKDSVYVKTTSLNGTDIEIPLSGNRADEIYLLVNAARTINLTAEVIYKDGSKEVKEIVAPAGQSGNAVRYESNYAGHTSGPRMRILENTDGTFYASNNGDRYKPEVTMLKFDVSEEKKLDKIVLNPIAKATTSWQETLIVYGITEAPMSNEDMIAAIEANTITEATSQNVAEIVKLDGFASELVERHALREEEVKDIRALKEEAEFYLSMEDPLAYTWNIKNYFNVDTLAYEGDTLGETWLALDSPDYTNVPAINVKNNLVSGIGYVAEQKVVEDSAASDGYSWQETGVTIPFGIDENSLNGSVSDAIFLDSSASNDRVTINADEAAAKRRAKEIVLLAYSQGTYGYVNFNAEVKYTDGTKEVSKISARKGRSAATMKDYSCAAGVWQLWSGNFAIKNDNGVAAKQTGRYPHISLFKFPVDSTKVIDEISFVCNDDRNNDETNKLLIYGITSMTMSNEELKSEIASATEKLELDGYTTYENTDMAKKAESYVDELEVRHVEKSEVYPEALAYGSQARAQEPVFAELLYDADILAMPGDTASLDITDDVPDVAELIDDNNVVTLKAPSNEDYGEDPEIGRQFKLNGINAGVNDSVSLQGKDYTLDIGGKILNQISASIYYSDGLNEAAGSKNVFATINYSDGTSEEVQAAVGSACSWHTGQNFAHVSDYEMRWDEENGKWLSGGYAEGVSTIKIASSVFEPSEMKEIDSITFQKQDDFVVILAVTEVPYTNDEYMDIIFTMEDALMEEEISESNAKTVYDGSVAALDMIARGNLLLAEEKERYQELFDEADVILNPVPAEVVFENPVITVEGANVTATVEMKNTTANDKNYILIIAAYDSNDSLIGIKSTGAKTLLKETESASDTVSMPIPSNTSYYKAFVWENMKNITPLSYSEYGLN